MDKEIRIENLSPRQVEMLEIMWGLEDYEDVEAWQATLDPEERKMSETLMKMILLEMVDNLLEVDNVSQARDYLKQFQL